MRTVYDVQQFLKRFGTIIYTGNRDADLLLMKEEMRELHHVQIIDDDLYELSMKILQENKNKEIMEEK